MIETASILAGRRSAVRRALTLTCQVMSDLWEGPAPHVARDLSPKGVWLDTELPLEVGEKIVLSITPPGLAFPLYLYGRVSRVRLARRSSDEFSSGMGVEFERVSEWDARTLDRALAGLPVPKPGPRYGHSAPKSGEPAPAREFGWLERLDSDIHLPKSASDDDDLPAELRLACDGALLTAGGKKSFWH
jgi:hypothetical protein